MQIAFKNEMISDEESSVFWGLTFTAGEPGVVVNMRKTGSPDAVSLEYCLGSLDWTDDSNWNTFDADNETTPITLTNAGDKVYFRAGASGNTRLSTNDSNCRTFVIRGSTGAGGNIMSLLARNEADWQSVQMGAYCFFQLFYGCTSLTSAPELPATILADSCYADMFREGGTFVTAPALPAPILAPGCYTSMFWMCENLNAVTVGFSDWNEANYSTFDWLTATSSRGTFACPAALDTTTRTDSTVPEGWTVVTVSS